MNSKTLTLIVLACMLAAVAPASAQDANPNWRGQDNEFGSIRAPYAVEMNGERTAIEAQVILRHNYADKDGRFYMFAFTVENTPLDLTFDNLIRTDTNEEIDCYQRQGDPRSQLKCFVDLRNMPPEGTEIIMRGTVGSERAGGFQAGAIVVPFTATWLNVRMSNGLEADLYAGTMVNVKTATSGSNTLHGIGNKVPSVGVVGLVSAGLIAVGLAAARRRD